MFRKSWFVAALTCTAFVAVPAVRAAEKSAVATVAHIRLHGELDEAPVANDPLFALGAENLRMKLDRIKKAKDDKNIQALYLQIDGLEVGWAKAEELRKAIADFRAAGKKVFAYLESGEARDYLVALACDEVVVPESGWLMLTGLRSEATFFKDLLDKLGIKADVLQMGDYKGAVEPFTRTSLSKEVRQNLESVLDDFYEKNYVGVIVQSRAGKKFTAEQVKKLIDEGPYTAKKALALGLVDRVAYSDGFRDAMQKSLDTEKLVVQRNYGMPKPEEPSLAMFMKLLSPPPTSSSSKPKIAVIYAVGPITTGKGGEGLFGGHVVGSTSMIQAIRQAENDKTVKAIVLRVDSPGGSALASDLIWNELKRSKKPVIASMSDVAASGGYYISMAAAKIYAEPGTITGSIGVFGMKLVLGGLENKIGISTEVISRGTNAGILSTSTEWSPTQRKAMTGLIEDVYDQFLTKALEGRKKAGKEMTRVQLEKLAGGRIWTGRQAKENGLVDELGTLQDAIAAAKTMSGSTEEMELLILPRPKPFLDALIDKGAEDRLSMQVLGILPLVRRMPELGRHLQCLEGLFRDRKDLIWAATPFRLEVK